MPWPKGKKRSSETRRKMRASHAARLRDPETRAEMLRNLDRGRELANSSEGRAQTAERMRAEMTGRVVSEETRERLRVAGLGKQQSSSTRSKRSASMRLAHAEDRHPGWSHITPERTSKLEETVAHLLDELGVRYERQVFIHVRGMARHPWDFVLRDRGILLEVDGCYWHGCGVCGFPGVNGRMEKDAELTETAERAGWRVVRLKEHEVHAGEALLKLAI